MRLHFIAIGGSIMHSLALALHQQGHEVSGSDDAIHEPARSRLAAAGLLPAAEGWFPERLYDQQLDAVILGMHAKTGNPELAAAQQAGIAVYSFPAFLARMLQQKQQVVIAGSHGKTTITSMLMTVLQSLSVSFDHMVGAQVSGFANPVKLGSEGCLAVLEGDEYPSSCLDRDPKFLHFKPDVLLLSGVAWDHVNAFPTFEAYQNAFYRLLDRLSPQTPVVYDQTDPYVPDMLTGYQDQHRLIPYQLPHYEVRQHRLFVQDAGSEYPMQLAGTHNLRNLEGACTLAGLLGISRTACLRALQHFKGAEKRLQQWYADDQTVVYRDFAHAPSKVKATLKGLREQYPDTYSIAVLELHTYSSLTPDFLPAYSGSLDAADEAAIFINPDAVAAKGDLAMPEATIRQAFGNGTPLTILHDRNALHHWLSSKPMAGTNVVLMSSGNFQGLDLEALIRRQLLQ